MNESNCVLLIKAVQIAPIRNLFSSTEDIISDINIQFTSEGIRIVNFDKTHTILVNVALHANKFEEYYCIQEKILICANTLQLFKVICTISNDDTLIMYIENCDYHDGDVTHLELRYDNGDIKQCYFQKLRLIEPDPEELILPDIYLAPIFKKAFAISARFRIRFKFNPWGPILPFSAKEVLLALQSNEFFCGIYSETRRSIKRDSGTVFLEESKSVY
jgi:Proliferating cell nuclear antigen, N-terminal domain